MSLSAQKLVDLMKEAARMTGEETAPFAFAIGKVMSPEPNIKILVEQKMILSDKQLVLTNAVRDYYVKLTTVGETLDQADGDEHYTEQEGQLPVAPEDYVAYDYHAHAYRGDKWWKVNLKLQAGEHVLMMRVDGGQKYIVLDRVFPPNNKGEIR